MRRTLRDHPVIRPRSRRRRRDDAPAVIIASAAWHRRAASCITVRRLRIRQYRGVVGFQRGGHPGGPGEGAHM